VYRMDECPSSTAVHADYIDRVWHELQRADAALLQQHGPRPCDSYYSAAAVFDQGRPEPTPRQDDSSSHIDELWEQLKLSDQQHCTRAGLTDTIPPVPAHESSRPCKRSCAGLSISARSGALSPSRIASPQAVSPFKRLRLDDSPSTHSTEPAIPMNGWHAAPR